MVQRALVSLLAVSFLAAGSADAATKRRGCPAKGGHTIAFQGGIRLYTIGPKVDRKWIACSNSLRRRVTVLTQDAYVNSVVDYRIAGHYVVLKLVSDGPDYIAEDLVFADLKIGRSRAIRTTEAGTDAYNTQITDWTLSPRGDVAFIALYFSPEGLSPDVGEMPYQSDHVVAWRARKRTLLDTAKEGTIGEHSLALSDDHSLYWKHGTEIRSATLS
jgi:hypothetical protein